MRTAKAAAPAASGEASTPRRWVDASPEAAGAAAFAVRMSQRAGTTCHLVHAARDVWASVGVEEGVDELWHALVDQARANITAVLAGVVPRERSEERRVG